MSVRPLALLLLLLYGSVLSADDDRPTGRNCDLAVPPKNAGEETNHGIILRIYPRARDMPKNYTGCQTLWMPHGTKWQTISVVKIEGGSAVRIWSPDEVNLPDRACRYLKGNIVRGDPNNCPSPDSLIMKSLPSGCVGRIAKAGGKFDPECRYE